MELIQICSVCGTALIKIKKKLIPLLVIILSMIFERDGKIRSEAVPLVEGMVDLGLFFRLLKEYKLEIPVSLHYEYSLGGAENGSSKLTIERRDVISAMKKDLSTLKVHLQDAGLS